MHEERFLASLAARPVRQRWNRTSLSLSAAVHTAVGVAALAAALGSPPALAPPGETRSIVVFEPPPPPPPKLPLGSDTLPRRERPRPATRDVTALKPDFVLPPEPAQPNEARLEPEPGVPESEQAGSPNGSPLGVPEGSENGRDGGMVGGVDAGVIGGVPGSHGPRWALAAAFDRPPRPLRQTRPVYPQEAFVKRVEGEVLLEILIDAAGVVADARVLRSIPLLDAAALRTVLEWRFEPALMQGRPVPAIARAPVRFRLY